MKSTERASHIRTSRTIGETRRAAPQIRFAAGSGMSGSSEKECNCRRDIAARGLHPVSVSESVCDKRAAALLDRAVKIGYPDPNALLHMTPDRARRALRAFEAGQEALAWRIGGYIAIALYDPKHYPALPLSIDPPKAMTEESMKAVLRGIGKESEA